MRPIAEQMAILTEKVDDIYQDTGEYITLSLKCGSPCRFSFYTPLSGHHRLFTFNDACALLDELKRDGGESLRRKVLERERREAIREIAGAEQRLLEIAADLGE